MRLAEFASRLRDARRAAVGAFVEMDLAILEAAVLEVALKCACEALAGLET